MDKGFIRRLIYTNTGQDTVYTLYTFDRYIVNVSLEPAWDGFAINWQYVGNGIRIGFQDYIIKESSDTSLIIEAPDFRRIKLLAEEYSISKVEVPIVVASLNGIVTKQTDILFNR